MTKAELIIFDYEEMDYDACRGTSRHEARYPVVLVTDGEQTFVAYPSKMERNLYFAEVEKRPDGTLAAKDDRSKRELELFPFTPLVGKKYAVAKELEVPEYAEITKEALVWRRRVANLDGFYEKFFESLRKEGF